MFYNSILYYYNFIFLFGTLLLGIDITPYDKYFNIWKEHANILFGASDTVQLLSLRSQTVCSNTKFGGVLLHIKNLRYTNKIFPG